MNLHILTDSGISQTFYRNLRELGLLPNNRVVVNSRKKMLTSIQEPIPFAPLYTPQFRTLTGETTDYDKVFIHQLSPLMYRWIAMNEFKELHWMIWGADLYNLPGIDMNFYEPLTYSRFIKGTFSREQFLFRLKISLTNARHCKTAYSKVSAVHTWMKSEYDFARHNLPALTASHSFFFYENSLPYHRMDQALEQQTEPRSRRRTLIVGNSGTPTNNHLDAIQRLEESGARADLVIPVSYGDRKYISFLRKNLPKYSGGNIQLLERFMPFDEYLNFCMGTDGLIMNNIRPQGYGNILMMMYMGKPVFINEKNVSAGDLEDYGLSVTSWGDLVAGVAPSGGNRDAINRHLSHERLAEVYRGSFS